MRTFKDVIENFSVPMDSLRDFVNSVGPVLRQRQEDVSQAASETLGALYIARLLTRDDLEALEIPADQKSVLMDMRNSLLKLASDGSPETEEEAFGRIRKVIPVKVEGGKIKIHLDEPTARQVLGHHRAIEKVKEEVRLLHESSLMALTSRSEWLIAQLVHLFFDIHPSAAGMSEPFFSLDTLTSLQTIEEAREVLIDHKVEILMRQTVDEWLQFFKSKSGLGMSYIDPERHQIAEIFKRRNLIVHNGGRVNRLYFKEVDEPLRVGLKLGDIVEITPDYLNTAIDLIEHQFVLLAAELWKKLTPEDNERGKLLLRLSFDRLMERKWLIARGWSYFVMNDKTQSEDYRLRGQINYWQSFKWSGQYDDVRGAVESSDFSAKSGVFKLAYAAIRDDFDSFFKLLPGVLDRGELTKESLMEWPLFQGARERPEFAPFRETKVSAESRPETQSDTAPSLVN
jgi:hypothetical protein